MNWKTRYAVAKAMATTGAVLCAASVLGILSYGVYFLFVQGVPGLLVASLLVGVVLFVAAMLIDQ